MIGMFISLLIYAGNPVVRNVKEGIEMRNDIASIIISEDAVLFSCVEIATGDDIAAHDHTKIASITTKNGGIIQANKAVLEGDILRLFFGAIKVDLTIQAYSDYFTLEIQNDYSSSLESITFIDLKLKYNFSDSNPFLATGVAMSLETDPVFYSSGESREVSGRCTAHTGMKGAKLAIVACRKDELRSILKRVYEIVPPKSIPVSLAGGPYALDSEINKGDCIIVSKLDTNRVQDYIDFCLRWGISQIDFHVGPRTFIQGDFSFPTTGSAAAFKTLITDPLKRAGIVSVLHTYSFYIGYDAIDILSNPKWQQQIELGESLTLSRGISASATEIGVKGERKRIINDPDFGTNYSPYLLIDNEIIKYTIGTNGFSSCRRGQCGTKASPHKAGAEIKLIGGHFSRIAPRPGSELFYEIAHRIAKAYNEGGFGGIYLDALDGLSLHLKNAGIEDYRWYYGASFVNEVLKYCKETPLIEYSTLYPSIWSARGRGGAWDTPNRGYKNFIDDHIKTNKSLISRQYVTTLGWFNFYPHTSNQQGFFSTKYLFFDDVDYLGYKAVAYDQTIVYNQLKIEDVDAIPALRRNLENYARYNNLRTSNYFSDKVKSILRQGDFEYRLVKKNGRWGFKEAVYLREKIHDISNTVLSGDNPFKRQKPFIRIENLYSSDSRSPITLSRYNERASLIGQLTKKVFNNPLDLSNHKAIRITLKGNGIDSHDALCVRLMSSSSSGYSDYVVRTNFDGWRDIVLSDLDNAEYPKLKFKDMEDNLYQMHRMDMDYSHVTSMQVFVAGECRDIKIRSIEAVPLVSNTLNNPQITIGNASLTFTDTIQSGEYLEYQVGDKAALVYDSIGNSRVVTVSRSGRFRVPIGEFTASVTGTPELTNAPSEVILTIGLYGQFIKN
jgi:hypothetical protein